MKEFLIGISGVVVGAALQYVLDELRFRREQRDQKKLDDQRKDLLEAALKDDKHEWRKLSTLCGIIGADPRTTTRLLIELGARGSEGEEDVWALKSKKPL